jgi:hypothetical protein
LRPGFLFAASKPKSHVSYQLKKRSVQGGPPASLRPTIASTAAVLAAEGLSNGADEALVDRLPREPVATKQPTGKRGNEIGRDTIW